jgi:hypothetical protein
MTLKTSPQVQRIIIRCQWMDALMTVNSGEMLCTTKSECPADGLTSSEIAASPPRPHVGQLRTKATTGMGAIQAVWANGSLAGCLKLYHSVVYLRFEAGLLMTNSKRTCLVIRTSRPARRLSVLITWTRAEESSNANAFRASRSASWCGSCCNRS